ncbi:hypothetical protein KZ483_26580 [Paenibacillus sp. sptzw28]|nr:hypothetical protein KZ483_26580 [Paenibacillus sp. sptzw28]
MISWDVTIIDSDVHKIDGVEQICGRIIIGDRVWIGHGASILKNVKIGDNVVIGAKSVVTKDIPANSVAVGNPARVIQQGITWSP